MLFSIWKYISSVFSRCLKSVKLFILLFIYIVSPDILLILYKLFFIFWSFGTDNQRGHESRSRTRDVYANRLISRTIRCISDTRNNHSKFKQSEIRNSSASGYPANIPFYRDEYCVYEEKTLPNEVQWDCTTL